MKKNKLFLMACITLFSLGFVSCNNDEYSVGPEVGNIEVTFKDEKKIALGLEATEFKITINRTEATEALTVPINVLFAPPTTTVPSSVTFEAGEDSKEITIAAGEGIETGKSYILALSVPKEYAKSTYQASNNPYSQFDANVVEQADNTYSQFNATIVREDYKVWATAIVETYIHKNSLKRNIEYSALNDLYRLPDFLGAGYPWYFKWDGKPTTDKNVFFIADENGKKIERFYAGFDYGSYGKVTANISSYIGDDETEYCGYYELLPDVGMPGFLFGVEFTVSAGSFDPGYIRIYDIKKK